MRLRMLILFACILLPATALARAPASVNLGSRKLQCRAMTCACGVCSRCATQAEKEDCEKRAAAPEVNDSGEHGTYPLNDDGAVVDEDADD